MNGAGVKVRTAPRVAEPLTMREETVVRAKKPGHRLVKEIRTKTARWV